jgi:hypothetical protein
MGNEEALLLTENGQSSELRNVAKVLRFFGIPVRVQTVAQFQHHSSGDGTISKARLICSSDIFETLITGLAHTSEGIRQWQRQVHSAFVWAGEDVDVLRELARKLTGDNEAALDEINPSAGDFVFSDGVNGFCGVMTGVSVTPSKKNVDRSLLLKTSKRTAINVISLGQGTPFARLEYQGISVFFSTCRDIIDIDARIATGVFDIRNHVLSAAPIVSYVRWAFTECWHAPEMNACLVIDDPLLKRAYGHFDFQEFLSLMKRHRFSTNVAMIPWNWRRSSPKVVRLFKENPEAFSISIHGCDHTPAEFGDPNKQRLYWRVNQALARMNHHESRTGIRHDRVFVFPQGVFSEAAMRVLKHTDLIAAVNNDTISADRNPRAITISDVWDVAVMGYSDFPIFTRRYPWEGVENFAFDALLGKPAIVVIHHDFCSDRCLRLVDFVECINALSCPPTWRSLGEVVSRSCRQRELLAGAVEVEMYGTELRVQNTSGKPKRLTIRKREHDPSVIKGIHAGPQHLAWDSSGGHIDFEVELAPRQNTTVRIKYNDLTVYGDSGDNLPYKIKTLLRRCLSEARDNYFMRYMPSLASRFFQVN